MTTLCLEDYTPPMTAPTIPIPENKDVSPAVLGVAPGLMTEITENPQLAQTSVKPASRLTRFTRVLSEKKPASAGFRDED